MAYYKLKTEHTLTYHEFADGAEIPKGAEKITDKEFEETQKKALETFTNIEKND